jgi:hypothetical protein
MELLVSGLITLRDDSDVVASSCFVNTLALLAMTGVGVISEQIKENLQFVMHPLSPVG